MDGTAQLAGRLDVDLINGFLPINGQTFDVISASGGVTGTFDEVNLPAMAPILRMDVKYLPTQVQLAVLPSGDFNGDLAFNCSDVDALVMQVVAGGASAAFDMNGDGSVNSADVSVWLAEAGAANLPSGNPYLPGDANLDGVVDGSDFVIWNSHKFTTVAAWCSGDFTADGVVDGQDFVVWNNHKFTSSAVSAMVPEPSSTAWAVLGLAALFGRQRLTVAATK